MQNGSECISLYLFMGFCIRKSAPSSTASCLCHSVVCMCVCVWIPHAMLLWRSWMWLTHSWDAFQNISQLLWKLSKVCLGYDWNLGVDWSIRYRRMVPVVFHLVNLATQMMLLWRRANTTWHRQVGGKTTQTVFRKTWRSIHLDHTL